MQVNPWEVNDGLLDHMPTAPSLWPSLQSRAPTPVPGPTPPRLRDRSRLHAMSKWLARGGGQRTLSSAATSFQDACVSPIQDANSRCSIPLVAKLIRSCPWWLGWRRASGPVSSVPGGVSSDKRVPGKTVAVGSWWWPFVRRPSKNAPLHHCVADRCIFRYLICEICLQVSLTAPNRKSQPGKITQQEKTMPYVWHPY